MSKYWMGLLVVLLGLGGFACGDDKDEPKKEVPCVGAACEEEPEQPCVGEECEEEPDQPEEPCEGEDCEEEEPGQPEGDLCEREPASEACAECQVELVLCKAMSCATESEETLMACLEANCAEFSDCFSFVTKP